jgi:CDP-paratose 2-epimerase
VRDNIHSTDVAQFAWEFIQAPRVAEVYNIGGGKENSCSILEAFKITESITGITQDYSYIDQARLGDHICYYSDLAKIKAHYPNWNITISLDKCLQEIVTSWKHRLINL